jgi:hypothetical protein
MAKPALRPGGLVPTLGEIALLKYVYEGFLAFHYTKKL